MKGKKTPHRPEVCRTYEREAPHAHKCLIFGRDMGANKNGEPWKHWACPHYKPLEKNP